MMRHTLDIALARQPIFDRTDHVIGYELLYRRTARDTAALAPDDPGAAQMTTDTIAGTFLGMGLERVTGGKRAFVNIDRWMLLDGSVRVLDPNQVVLEILESVACDPETLAACSALVNEGYVIALDDFEYSESYEPLLRLARIVKVDVLDKSEATLTEALNRLRPFGVSCLAERVESSTTRLMCARLGFDLFQGYYFARPETLSGREIPVEQAHIIRLLNLLRDPTQSDVVLEEIFRRDISLTYKLLRIVNSASTGHTGVTSIGHGIRLLGRGSLHRWMALLLVSSMATRSPVHGELVEMAMIRARFCELITETFGQRRDGGASFVAGLFSLLDALMEVSMSELVERLDLTPELKQVLVAREGPFAPALRVVEAYESARWTEVFETITLGDAVTQMLPDLYLRAVEWAHANNVNA
jgi:c-di-GMP phosphodiesterase